MEALLVACHRLKGSAASIGLHEASRLAHSMEDVIQARLHAQAPANVEDCDALLQSVDSFRSYLTGLRNGHFKTDVLNRADAQLSSLAGGKASEVTSKVASSANFANQQVAAALRAAPDHRVGFVVQIQFDRDLPLVELKARLLLNKLHHWGEVFFCSPAEEELDVIGSMPCLTVGVATNNGRDDLQRELRVEGVCGIEMIALGRDDATPASSPGGVEPNTSLASTTDSPGTLSPSTHPKARPSETVRVDIERLDQLMGLAGQLVITKARFSQIGTKLKSLTLPRTMANVLGSAQLTAARLCQGLHETATKEQGNASLATLAEQLMEELTIAYRDLANFGKLRAVIGDLSEAVHQLDRVSEGIQDNVMETRMVPIGPLFNRFKRAVRDLTRGNQKEVRLEIRGENTELDKRMIEELGDPLVHLVRNSVDHGIEPSDARVAAGKTRQGLVTLDAYHRGNRIVIEVSDDGRGLDTDRIRRKGIDKGLITQVDAENMTSEQLCELIWKPGFSTAEKVTEVSGRGMGMDIVRAKIEQLNGSVKVTSEQGRGTVFSIHLPLTMAILPSLLTVIDNDVFSIPVESVVEIVRVNASEVASVNGQRVIHVRGRVVGVVELHDLFEWNQSNSSTGARDKLTVVIVGSQVGDVGLVVDDLLGEQDVVIKSLADNFRNVEGIAGASILGDGRVSLILDIAALLDLTCCKAKTKACSRLS
jgi:two-component system chemotaxis sensor kinase CheA